MSDYDAVTGEVVDEATPPTSGGDSLPVPRDDRVSYPTLSVDELADMLERVEDAKNRVLRSGLDKDYAVIPGTGDKPSLLKPGAEKLCQLFGYRIRSMDAVEYDQDPFGVLYKCVLHDANGHIVGVCDGWCDAGETKAKRGRWDKNTIRKMAQKRAFVGATLWACNASSIFTQDVEDLDVGGPTPRDEPVNVGKTPEELGLERYHGLVDWYLNHAKLDSSAASAETVGMACQAVGIQSTDDLADPIKASEVRAFLLSEQRTAEEAKQPEAPPTPDPAEPEGPPSPGELVLKKLLEEYPDMGKDDIFAACKESGIKTLDDLAEEGAYEWVITLLNERQEEVRASKTVSSIHDYEPTSDPSDGGSE